MIWAVLTMAASLPPEFRMTLFEQSTKGSFATRSVCCLGVGRRQGTEDRLASRGGDLASTEDLLADRAGRLGEGGPIGQDALCDVIAQARGDGRRAGGGYGDGDRSRAGDGGHGERAAGTFLAVGPIDQDASLMAEGADLCINLWGVGCGKAEADAIEVGGGKWPGKPPGAIGDLGGEFRGYNRDRIGRRPGLQQPANLARGDCAGSNDQDPGVREIEKDRV